MLLFNTLLNKDQPGQGGEGDEGAKNIQHVHGHVLASEVDPDLYSLKMDMQDSCNDRIIKFIQLFRCFLALAAGGWRRTVENRL